MDYIGSFYVKIKQSKEKVWCIVFTCMYTRAINIKVCADLSTIEFLRSFQLHVYDFGIPESCTSDLGSRLTAGANIFKNVLSDFEIKTYLESYNIKMFSFTHYPKGNSTLGSLVESCVKLIKHIIFKSIRRNVLCFKDFEFLISKVIHLVNKRPIAFKHVLHSNNNVLDPITPELLIK